MMWFSGDRDVLRVQFGAVLQGKPEGWSRPFATRYSLWVWLFLRPRHAGWRRRIEQKHESHMSTWRWGPFELTRRRPPHGTRPDLYWRFTRERHLHRERARLREVRRQLPRHSWRGLPVPLRHDDLPGPDFWVG